MPSLKSESTVYLMACHDHGMIMACMHMACHDHTHEIPERGPNNLPVCSMKDVQCWSHMSTLTTDGN